MQGRREKEREQCLRKRRNSRRKKRSWKVLSWGGKKAKKREKQEKECSAKKRRRSLARTRGVEGVGWVLEEAHSRTASTDKRNQGLAEWGTIRCDRLLWDVPSAGFSLPTTPARAHPRRKEECGTGNHKPRIDPTEMTAAH